MDGKEKNKGQFIVIIILSLIVIGLVGYIGYDKFLSKNEKSGILVKSKTDNANSNRNSDSIKVINFDRNKCINNNSFSDDNYKVSRTGISAPLNGLVSLSLDGEKTVNITARYDLMFPEKFTDADIKSGNVKYFDDIKLTFDKKVESIFSGSFGADIYDGKILFLLEDGTVEYMKFSDIYDSQKFEHKLINEVKDIIKFDNVSIELNENNVGANYTTIAYKMDGTYYDLSKFIG